MTILIVVAVIVLFVLLLAALKGAGRAKDTSNGGPAAPAPPTVRRTPVNIDEQKYVPALSIPISETLPPNGEWENRFEVCSTTSSRRYVVAQHKEMRYWSCSCPGWKGHRRCKHLDALSLPPDERPHEVCFETTGGAAQPQAAKLCPPELSDFPNVDLSSAVPPRYVVFDLETTGLDPIKDDIIEVGALRVTHGSSLCDTFHALVKPKRRVPKFITQMTGISQDMVDRDGEPLETVVADFAEFIGDLPLVSYGADFDMGFLQDAAKRQNVVLGNRVSCALKMARRAWPNLKSHKLGDVSNAGNFDQNVRASTSDEGTHRALGDCKRTMFVYICAATQLGFTLPPPPPNTRSAAATA